VTFYSLEDKGSERMTIFFILRYALLNGRFDENFYKGIDSDCPLEGYGIKVMV
jgi:hypothetical protein